AVRLDLLKGMAGRESRTRLIGVNEARQLVYRGQPPAFPPAGREVCALISSILPRVGVGRRLLPDEPRLPVQDSRTTRRVRRINPVRQNNKPGAGGLRVALQLLVPRGGGVVGPIR